MLSGYHFIEHTEKLSISGQPVGQTVKNRHQRLVFETIWVHSKSHAYDFKQNRSHFKLSKSFAQPVICSGGFKLNVQLLLTWEMRELGCWSSSTVSSIWEWGNLGFVILYSDFTLTMGWLGVGDHLLWCDCENGGNRGFLSYTLRLG